MKKVALLAIAAASLLSTAAMAQEVRFGVGGGPAVSIDNGYREDYRGYRRSRDYRRSYNRYRDDDDTVVVRRDRRYRDRGDRVYIERD